MIESTSIRENRIDIQKLTVRQLQVDTCTQLWYNITMHFNNTNLNLYKSFIVAYQTKNLHRAAKVLGITREAVRKNIKELGNQLGIILFKSHSKGIEPTLEAESIYPSIKNAIDTISETENRFYKFNAEKVGTIKLSVQGSVAESYISAFLKEFSTNYPQIQLEFTKPETAEFVINDAHIFENTKFKTIELFQVTAAFAASKNFLKKNNVAKNLSKEQLLGFTIIARNEAWNHFNWQARVIRTTSSETTLKMTKESLGIGCFSKEFLTIKNDKDLIVLDIIDVEMPTAKIVCGYVTLSKHAHLFITEFSKYCQSLNKVHLNT